MFNGRIVEIDPIDIKDSQQEALMMKVLENKANGLIQKNAIFAIQNDSGIIIVRFSRDLLIRKSKRSPNKQRYEVLSDTSLGNGSFGSIYEVLKTLEFRESGIRSKSHKKRIIKLIEFTYGEERIKREVRFIEIANKLRVKEEVIENGDNGKKIAYVVMRKLDISLQDYVFKKNATFNVKQLTTLQLFKLTSQLLKAYKEQLSDKGIIHRDLKPANIMLDPVTGEIIIIDFGLSKNNVDNDRGIRPGTHGFIAPETYAGLGTTNKSDIYALARVIAFLWGAKYPRVKRYDDLKNKLDDKTLAEKTKSYQFDEFLNGIDQDTQFPFELKIKFKQLIFEMDNEDPQKRPDIETIIRRVDEIILEYNANLEQYNADVNYVNTKMNDINNNLANNTDIKNIPVIINDAISEFTKVTWLNEEAASRQFLSSLNGYALMYAVQPSWKNIVEGVNAMVNKHTTLQNNLTNFINEVSALHTLQAKDANYLCEEAAYWIAQLQKCPANLDKIMQLNLRVEEELQQLSKIFIEKKSTLQQITIFKPALPIKKRKNINNPNYPETKENKDSREVKKLPVKKRKTSNE